MAVGGGQVSEPAKTDEIVHPRTDFREAMKAAGATDAEIEALMLAHVRMDGWCVLGFIWVTLIGFPLVNRIVADNPGLSTDLRFALTIGGMMAPMLVYMFLLNRSVRSWISIYESRFELMIAPGIRYRASENTYEEFLYRWVAFWIVQAILLSLYKSPSFAFIFGLAAFNGAVILGTMQWKTGSVRISAPVKWGDEVFFPHQIKATAGSVVGQFQSQERTYTWEEAKKERALMRADRAAIRAWREGRRPK
ncbi:MAG: hypothetical protein ACK5XS_03450 [Armatimonadota bacterium]|jgi:hypothetical protein|nr:hypothetical protein [Fimbriimonadaceae bacterium]